MSHEATFTKIRTKGKNRHYSREKKNKEKDKLYYSISNDSDVFLGPWIKGNVDRLAIIFESLDMAEKLAPYFFTSLGVCRSLVLMFCNTRFSDRTDLIMPSFGETANGVPSSLFQLPSIRKESLRELTISFSSCFRRTNYLNADDLVDWLHQYSSNQGEGVKAVNGGRHLQLHFEKARGIGCGFYNGYRRDLECIAINIPELRSTLIKVFTFNDIFQR